MHASRLLELFWIAPFVVAPACATAQTAGAVTAETSIRVEGTATVERAPDRAILVLAVESEGATAQAASQANANLMTSVIAALRQERLDDTAIRTLSVRLEPVYAQGQNREAPRIVGYRARNGVQATVDDVARVGAIIDAAIGAGANRVNGLNFTLQDPEQARLAALTAAFQSARREAEVVAAAAGRVLGAPLEIVVSPAGGGPRPVFAAYERGVAMAQAAETPVEGGVVSISASVTVIYRLDER